MWQKRSIQYDSSKQYAAKKIYPAIRIQKVNEAYDRLLKSDVKYRFVIDMNSLKSE